MGTLTYRSTGTVARNGSGAVLTPGAPAGKQVGDLLVGITWQRSASSATEANWTKKFAQVGSQALEVWLRIADGSANDAFAPDWSGTNDCGAFVEAWYGDVDENLTSIVAHSIGENSSGSTNLILPAFTGGSVANCLLYCVARKNNTAFDATAISHVDLTVRTQALATYGSSSHVATGTIQQTTYADFDGSNFTVDGTSESLASNGIVLYLRTASATATKKVKVITHPSAAGATGVEVVVHSAPSGSDYITGTTRYGSDNGLSFEATTEGTGEDERAVLKVPAADVGCSGLTVDTVVAVCIRNATFATEVIPGIIIEE